MLRLYLDESERTDLFAVAGFIAPEARWESFETDWRVALRTAGVEAFHASDFYNCRGIFTSWREAHKRRVRLSRKLCAIAANHPTAGVGMALERRAFDEIVAPYPELVVPSTPHDRITPRLLCTHMCLEVIACDAPKRPKGEPIEVIFESAPGVGEVVSYCTHHLKKHYLWAEDYVSFTSVSKGPLPLEAADLLVYETGKRCERQIAANDGLAPETRRRPLKRLLAENRVKIVYADREKMAEAIDVLARRGEG